MNPTSELQKIKFGDYVDHFLYSLENKIKIIIINSGLFQLRE